MDQDSVKLIIGAIVLLIALIVAIVIGIKKNPAILDKQKAKEFLKGLSDVFYQKMVEIINALDITKYSSLEEFESDILGQIYDTLWAYTEERLKDEANKDILSALVLKILDKDFVIAFINDIIKENGIVEQIEEIWVDKANTKILLEDQELQQKFSGAEGEYYENATLDDLTPAENVQPSEEELNKLNPPKDEVEYDTENDPSVEVVDDDKYFYDSKGRRRSKATGRYA